ncbi:MAG: hypothetical protein LBQ16_07245, partial [Gracilibacteraceae bacterium]|nr:hypothetical protein [Gracilibacteraceae bacterium]
MSKKPLFVFNLQWILPLLLICLMLFLVITVNFVLGTWNEAYRAALEEDAAVALDEYNSFFREQISGLNFPADMEETGEAEWLADYLASRADIDFFVLYAGEAPIEGSGKTASAFLELFAPMIMDCARSN